MEEAKIALTEAKKLNIGSPYEGVSLTLFRSWANLYRKSGDFRLASYYQQKYIDLNDKIINSKMKEMLKIQSEFNNYENRKTIQTQKFELALKEQGIYNRQLLIILIGSIASTLLILIILVFQKYNKKKKQNILLDEKVKDRTRVIEENILFLSRKIENQNQLHWRMISNLKQQLGTMRGLINVLKDDRADLKTVREGVALVANTEAAISGYLNSTTPELL